MKHAGDAALDSLEGVLKEIRKIPGLTEKKRGIFYQKSVAFLHFHEEPMVLFADLKKTGGWMRFRINSPAERTRLVKMATAAAKTQSQLRSRGVVMPGRVR